jgi:two-component sensor histidine kinase
MGENQARTNMRADDGEICGAGQKLDEFMDELLANREERIKSEKERALLRDELEHRVKNLLETIQAVARHTFPRSGNEDALDAFSRRLAAIGEANKLLRQADWQSTSMDALAQTAVAPFPGSDSDRIRVSGPQVVVKGSVALAISMALHELCTNAVKYGALSNESGAISIEWELAQNKSGEYFSLVWKESGGPPAVAPEKTGFGSRVIKEALAAQIGGKVELLYDYRGVICRVLAPSDNVVEREDAEAPAL